MCQVKEQIRKHFKFLNDYGYETITNDNEKVQIFQGKSSRIEVEFNPIGYELTCQFSEGKDRNFSLSDGLAYIEIRKYKGLYQIGIEADIEKGVSYIAEATEELFKQIDISDKNNFQKIYQFRVETQKQLLEEYYLKNDLKKAEIYWNEKKYVAAKELLEKHIENLSKSQLKKIEYINNHINC